MEIMSAISGGASVPAITAICYALGYAWKKSSLNEKWIPLLCLCVGCVLGIAGLYLMPSFPADDIISAIALGMASGLASTGANQVMKQLRKEVCGDTQNQKSEKL